MNRQPMGWDKLPNLQVTPKTQQQETNNLT